MAYIGLVKPTIAKLDESMETPVYTDGFTCGKAVSLDLNPQYAEGSLYADDEKAEYDKEFKYADVTLNTSTMPIQAHNVMFGHTVENVGENGTSIKIRTTDSPNYVGFGIYVKEKVNNVKRFVAMWIYKVKFTEGQESFKTKGDNIEYQTPSIAGQAIGISDNLWKEIQIFDTEKEARDWIDEMAGIKKKPEQSGGAEAGEGEHTGSGKDEDTGTGEEENSGTVKEEGSEQEEGNV